ncbi:MAG TPA: FtsX-like permease family protein, partial [Micromonosporaceae bacterium]|nr:FtsX-like permease family protein [Micromonosporaceae bacterium]
RINRLIGSMGRYDNGPYYVVTPAGAAAELGTFITRAKFTGSATIPGIAPITLAGVLIGLLMVAAAAVFWVLRRSRELTILSARGIGAGALGLKAVIEALPALVIGAVAGWAAAVALVREAGPVSLITGGTPRIAAYLAAASLVASALVVGVMAGMRCRSLADEHRRRHRFHILHWPWEVLLLAGAPVAWHFMSGATTIQDLNAGVVVHVPARLLVVPLMVIIGAAAFLGRLTVVWLRRRTRRASPRSSALYIGLQRIAREAAIVVVLAGATAAPIALAAYGGTVTRSVKASVDAEAKMHVGSDVVVNVPRGTKIPASLADHATSVARINGLIISGVQTDILAVDPRTFAQGAYWDAQINGESMNQMIAALRAPGADAKPYPAIGTTGVPTGGQTVSYITFPSIPYEVHDVPVLPAAQGGYPVMIVPAASFTPDNPAVAHQIWIRGDPVKIRAELVKANLPITHISSSDDLFVDTLYDPLTFTFEYLTALSLLGGLVTMVGLLLYLEARTPRHRRAYVMFRRMGLRPRTHRTALLIELGIPLTAGLIAGLALAAGLAKALSGNFDVDVAVPPGTILSLPLQVVVAIAAGVLVLAAVAASYAQLRIGRANPSEVLRDTI